MLQKGRAWKFSFYGVIVICVALMAPPSGRAEGTAGLRSHSHNVEKLLRELWGDDRLVDPVSQQGQQARGLYFNGPMQRRMGARGIIRAVKGANLDAVVLDLKDGQGRVMWDSKIDVLQPQKRSFVKDLPGLIAKLKAAGIYTIGRIVCFTDPKLPRNHPDRAVLDNHPKRKGQVWATTGHRNPWLDPYNRKNHDLIVEMAREAQAVGLDEVQLDYIRFPVDEATRFAVFPAQVETPRREVLLGLLKRIDEAITIPLGVDVFGLTAFRTGDPAGLGQSLEDWARHIEVFTPMLYINGMTHWVRDTGQGRAMRLINAAVKNLRRRLGHGPVIRPFIQAFPQGADYYTGEFIAEQVRGARYGGADGFLFWHPASNYSTVRVGMNGPGRGLAPFPLEERYWWRRQAWGDRMSSPRRAAYWSNTKPDQYTQ
ncbi:MAG: putative glycoside hydrolase [Myxococcales bacterium]|nr:putative glycoside hydrolase [Myxococcales bacterium]